MKKHFVIFCSPGTFLSEETEKPITSWDIAQAMAMADEIVERYASTPYCFYFITRTRKPTELDSKISKRSPLYFLGGQVLSLAQVKARKDHKDKILIGNMESNDISHVLVNINSWKITVPFDPKRDVILDYIPPRKIAKAKK